MWALPTSWAEQWNKWLDRDEITERQQTGQNIIVAETETKRLDEKLNTLLDGYLDGTIETNIYKTKKNELFENKVQLQDQIVKLQTQGSSWLGTNAGIYKYGGRRGQNRARKKIMPTNFVPSAKTSARTTF